MRYVLVGFAALVSVALASPPATGQAAETQAQRSTPLADSLTGSAKNAYDAGRVLLGNHNWAGAFAKFQEAYDTSKDPRLLFNMAVCARDMKAYARMHQLLVRYEQEAGAALSAEEKAQVAEALVSVRAHVGFVKVEVNEEGARVLLDGASVGKTPLSAPLVVDEGKHALSVGKAGFENVDRSIDAAGGSTTIVSLSLVREVHAAHLAIVSEPGATIVVDNQQVGIDRFEGSVAPGRHEIRLTSPGKKVHVSSVDLRDGETRALQVTLVPEPHAAPLWPWIVGGAALTAGLVVGGYFLFRPNDERAPGPVGSLGSVDLVFRTSER